MTSHYHVSRNIAGYLSESEDGTHPFTDWESARDSLADDVDRWADEIAQVEDTNMPRVADLLLRYDEAIEEVRANTSREPIDVFLPSSESDHALDVHFWLVECSENECFDVPDVEHPDDCAYCASGEAIQHKYEPTREVS